MLDAISAGANVIALIAVDPNLVQLGLKSAKEAGVLVVSGSNGIDDPNPVANPPKARSGSSSTSARITLRSGEGTPIG